VETPRRENASSLRGVVVNQFMSLRRENAEVCKRLGYLAWKRHPFRRENAKRVNAGGITMSCSYRPTVAAYAVHYKPVLWT